MLKNYFKIAWRNLVRHKSHSLINIVGLSVGMACCILIALYAREELSYDRFHEKAGRIITVSPGITGPDPLLTSYPLADAMEQEIPEVEKATRIKTFTSTPTLLLSRDGRDFVDIKEGKYAETDFFEVFSFPLLYGNEDKALEAPNQIVLTRNAGQKLFGEENPVGKSLYWQQRDTTLVMQVSGVVADPPQNSSISFGALISYNTLPESGRRPDGWTGFSHQTFAVLKSPDAIDNLPDRLNSLAEAYYDEAYYEKNPTEFSAIPLTSLHLSELSRDEGFTGNKKYLYLFGSVALFILFIACINYVNLATARVSMRVREVGIRKSLGAGRKQLAAQFLGESVLLSLGAYLLGILMEETAIPFFNQLFGTHLSWSESAPFLVWLGLGAIGVGLTAGMYPSLYLSGFSPASILRNRLPSGLSGAFLRKSLVVIQFGIALVLITGSVVIYKQLQFTQTKDLGFNGEQVVVVQLPNRQAWQMRNTLRDNVAAHPGIQEATVANGAPGVGLFRIRIGYKPEYLSPQEQAESEESINFAPVSVDYDFLEALDIDLLAGRNFSRQHVSDAERAYILNENMVERLGWTPEEAVGKTFKILEKEGEVIGVVENFHFASLHRELEPVVLEQLHDSKLQSIRGMLLARLHPGCIPETMDFLEEEIAKYVPYLDYEFLDEKFDAMYRTERRLGQVVALFTFIAIFVACLGLYGLAAFTAERRVKEIGIRKVLGATVANIVALLNKDFLKLVLLGFVIAVPVAWYAMNQWLEEFAYRIEIGPGIFVLAGGAAILIALLTVSWQSVRAALANPVESLRSE